LNIADITPNNNLNVNNEDDKNRFEYYKKYYDLHKKFLQPTNIKIDLELFNSEIKQYHKLFRQWGYNRSHNPRYGISLFNLDGKIDEEIDYGCCPLDTAPKELNLKETDFKTKTPVFNDMESMRVFDPISKYMIRSNILLFHKGGNFTPHIDTCPIPTRDYETQEGWNLRLWGNTDPKNYVFDYLGNVIEDVEPGRLYLTDTSRWHIAEATADWNYTFFIALRNDCIDEVHEWLI